jgi:hypothetical protein
MRRDQINVISQLLLKTRTANTDTPECFLLNTHCNYPDESKNGYNPTHPATISKSSPLGGMEVMTSNP